MSTICHLDPMVRLTRTDRAQALRKLAETIPLLADAKKALTATTVYAYLSEVHDNPAMTGAQKSDEFTRIINRIQKENEDGQGHKAND